MVRHLLLVILSVSLLIDPGSVRGDEQWPVQRGESREPLPYRYEPKRVSELPREFIEDHVATILYAGTTYLLESDGTVETITHEVTRLNGRKGIEKLGEYRGITFTPSYQKLVLNEARIHKASGKIVSIESRHVHLRDVSTDYQVYDPEKQLIISFPGLEVGDVLEVKWTTRGKNPEHEGQFFARYAFGDVQYPIALDECKVRLAKDRRLVHATVNGKLDAVRREIGAERLYFWKVTNRPRLPRDEHLPSREELRPTILLSTFTNWDQIGRWKHKLRAACWVCEPQVKQVVAEITRGLRTQQEKARALTYWVRRNIRYVSVGERHDYTPHHPSAVLANRFGDCKDTSQLLAVMLREAGIQVELATLGTLDDGQIHPDVPSPWGTHAILLATIEGKDHWIDTTASLNGWDVLPKDDLDRLCYLTDAQGKLRLKRTPQATPESNRVEQTTYVWIGADGTSRCQRKVSSSGLAAVSARDSYVEVPPGERRRQVTSELQDANSRTRLQDLQVDELALRDFDQPVVVQMTFEIPRHFTGSNEREGSVTDSRVWGRLLAYNVDADRTVPMVLPSPFESIHVYRFHAPTVMGFEGVPRDRVIRSKWGTFTVTSQALDDGDTMRHLEVRFHTRLEKTRIEVEDLEAFRKFHEEVNREYRVWVTLKVVAELASAERLEQWLAVAPQDALAARVLAKIYLQAGRLEDASRVLVRGAYYHPTDGDLSDLRVQVATGTVEEEKILRERLGRDPSRSQHVLELAANLITRGKHDEARALLEPLTRSKVGSVRALTHYQLARSRYRKDELKEALAELDAAVRADVETVDSLRVHILRGQILDELKQPKEAIVAYEKALEKNRRNSEVLLSLVRLHLLDSNELAALDYLRRYTLQVSDDVSSLLLAAETYYQLKRYDEALELALRARDKQFHERAQRLLGLVYLKRGDYERARRHLDRAEPDAIVLSALIRSTIATGAIAELEKSLTRAERLESSSAVLKRAIERGRQVVRRREQLLASIEAPRGKEDVWREGLGLLACAEALVSEKEAKDAVESLLKRVRETKLEVGMLHAVEGRVAMQLGKLAEARRAANRAITRSPNDPQGYYLRGRIGLEVEHPQAREDLEQAARLSGRKDVEILASLAEALGQEGNYPAAVETVRQALALKPGDVFLEMLLRRLEAEAKKKLGG